MKALLRAVAASCFVAVAILLLSWTAYFSQLNSAAYDFTLRLAGTVPIKSPTVIVAVDEDSLHRVGGWPWSRSKIAQLIDQIEGAKPRAIALDVLLDDRRDLAADQLLADSIGRAHAIVLPTHIGGEPGSEHWLGPDPMFVQKQTRVGHVHTDPDFDGINRRILPMK